jgi:hypothetical protein
MEFQSPALKFRSPALEFQSPALLFRTFNLPEQRTSLTSTGTIWAQQICLKGSQLKSQASGDFGRYISFQTGVNDDHLNRDLEYS